MTLLDPDNRDLYTDVLRPPPGMCFDAGVGATYSLDLDTLLTVPLHLLLYSGEQDEEELLSSGIAVHDALRKISSRLRLYCQRGRIQEPDHARSLYSLLERVAVEVEPPAGQGSFHPKLWVLRFRDEEDRTLLRLLVLSRNVTRDVSWDLVLQLEGEPGEEEREENRPLADLVRRLPKLADAATAAAEGPDLGALADELLRTDWELPGDFDRVRFHATGLEEGGWLPAASGRLAVVSPFCRARALDELVGSTDEAVVLVSRPEELLELDDGSLEGFGRVFVLDEMAEREDGEDLPAGARGLHAKLYVAESDGRTHLYLGSANATNAALLGGHNVEVMAELVGDTGEVGGIDEMLAADGLRALLEEWHPPDEPPETDPDVRRAKERLESARRALAGAGLTLTCEEDEDRWRLRIEPSGTVELADIRSLRAWPVTVERGRAVDGAPLLEGGPVELPVGGLSSLTGFVAFRLEAQDADETATFVLNLPVKGLPREERDAAVVRGIVRDRDSFLRYLLLLLGEIDEEQVLLGSGSLEGVLGGGWGSAAEELPLLEELTRAYCRDPRRLEEVRDLLDELQAVGGEDRDVVPDEFRRLWTIFEAALGEDAA